MEAASCSQRREQSRTRMGRSELVRLAVPRCDMFALKSTTLPQGMAARAILGADMSRFLPPTLPECSFRLLKGNEKSICVGPLRKPTGARGKMTVKPCAASSCHPWLRHPLWDVTTSTRAI